MNERNQIASVVEKSRTAQEIFTEFNQKQVDAVVREIAKTVYDNAEVLARMAVDETKMGVYEDKVFKNRSKSRNIWYDLKDKKSMGIIKRDKEKNLVLIAKPMGVVAAVIPATNPIVNAMSNCMFALKGKNSVIVSPSSRAEKSIIYTIELINKALEKFNTPPNLIQIIHKGMTQELMKAADVIIATGGAEMVKSAYSSGKPAYGVGPGNVQCIIDTGIDYNDAVKKMIAGRIFDNGIICSGEQAAIIPEDEYEQVIAVFENNGAYYIRDPKEKEALRAAMFIGGSLNKKIVGKSVQEIAGLAGFKVPAGTKVIMVEPNGIGEADVLCREKMCPVMIAIKSKDFKDSVRIAQANLNVEGKGHTAVVHSNNTENIEYAGEYLKVSRLIVNQVSAANAGGSLTIGYSPTTTIGCGSWGNNSISENLTYKHLLNITRIGYFKKDFNPPTDEEIWAEN